MSEHSHHHHHSGSKNLLLAFLINFIFTIIEFIGGLYTNSIAIMSDAIHDLGDSVSLGMSALFEHISKKKPNERFTFGYKRFSLLGALFSSLVLFGGTVYIITETIPRLLNPQEVDAVGMIVFSVLGIVFNGLAYYKTHKGHTLNEKSVSLHLLEDLLGWVAILIGSTILLFIDFYVLDALMSILISFYILYHVYRNLREIFRIFLEAAPRDLSISKLQKDIQSVNGVLKVYHMHLWNLSDTEYMMSTHILLSCERSSKEMIQIKKEVAKVASKNGVTHSTIEIDITERDCEL